MIYTFSEHLHNFAVWTAARAVQRNFTTTENIKDAIEKSGLQYVFKDDSITNPDKYDAFHKKCCTIIIKHLESIGIKNATYGRAAKIVAIYIKTAIVIKDSGNSFLSKIAHPPIDNILLTNISETTNLKLSGIKWTHLSEMKYFELIEMLRTLNFENFWEIEVYWTPIQKK